MDASGRAGYGGQMAAEAPKPVLCQALLADRLEWLCQVIHLECGCAVEDRLDTCGALEHQLDLALRCYARGDDAAALAICDRLGEQMRSWTGRLWT
jgi:hypothetical protein